MMTKKPRCCSFFIGITLMAVSYRRKQHRRSPGCVVVLTHGVESSKTIALGDTLAYTRWRDFLVHRKDIIETNEHGRANFTLNSGSVRY
ncbi:hypothetical protein ACQKDS_03570 [Serratia sp. NPDC078593]|uniref:hypothetical protein n=1 Tax=unclassified Serratia (in: enterobacteria) TaxID=2647522 RepID=UPI0037D35A5D